MSDLNRPTSPVSAGFSRAKQLSRFMATIFAIAFLVMSFVLLASLVAVIIQRPNIGIGLFPGIVVHLDNLMGWRAAEVMVGLALVLVPTVMVLHHARKLFSCFARGDVFAVEPIAHIRATGLWLIASFFTNFAGVMLLHFCCGTRSEGPLAFLSILFTGVATTIAAYVMEEAQRIAADHAEII